MITIIINQPSEVK